MRNITINTTTIGQTVDELAKAFSSEGDTSGLYILERALEKAREIRSQKQREEEIEALFASVRKVTTYKDCTVTRIKADHWHVSWNDRNLVSYDIKSWKEYIAFRATER